MEPNSTLGEPIGVVHVTINGQKVPANVYADRTCIMPDGTIRKVKQEVVDALLAKKRAAEIPAQTPVQQPATSQPHITRVQSQPVIQPMQPAAPQPAVQTPQTTMQYGVSAHGVSPAQAPEYQVPVAGTVQQPSQTTASVPNIPDPNDLPDQMTATRQTMVAQELMQQEANEAAKKRFGLGKGKKEKPASGAHHAASAPTQATAEPARPSQKKKSSKVIAAILAVVIVGGVAGYAFVPSVYDGVNGVLTAVTGHQVGVPPVSENGDDDVITPQPTVNQPASGSTDTTSNEVNKVLGDIDMSGDVTIEFYANVKTADGREYKVPLSTANLTDGTLTALLDSGGYPLTQNAQ
mgnify:FL=1